jgi:glycosyltransferase involved in cell wall biosynthesis
MLITHPKRLRILLIAEQCDPEGASVPLIAWNFFDQMSKLADVTLVTHERNQIIIEKHRDSRKIIYIQESEFSKQYFQVALRALSFLFRGKINWPLFHFLFLPIYLEFDQTVYSKFEQAVKEGFYDLVHAINPTIPRYPVKISQVCAQTGTPFLLGPLNGGIPFPKNFQKKASQEFAHFNFLRTLGRFLIPGYNATYRHATKVLVGSSYTLAMLKRQFNLSDSRISLFCENGIPEAFFTKPDSEPIAAQPPQQTSQPIKLLFVGRLVPYKCADLVLDAVARLNSDQPNQGVSLTIVGDGSERQELEAKARELKLEQSVHFTGWMSHQDTRRYYHESDIFCFPSIREFGGAVVLEAMASGLPCIVVNHGGISEYVTDATGFRIEPISTEYITQELIRTIQLLIENRSLREQMSQSAIERAKEFEWSHKAKQMLTIYRELVLEASITPISGSTATAVSS